MYLRPVTRLLGHLTSRLASHPETVATEALTFVLQQSAPCRAALERLVGSVGGPRLESLDYSAQEVMDGAGTPDVVGRAGNGSEQLIVEAKFWAGLTRHQPVSYLKRVAGGALLFVVPSARTDFVWVELVRRATAAAMTVTPTSAHAATVVGAGAPVFLAIVTWQGLLGALTDAARDAGDTASVDDLRQLEGLCTKLAGSGFLPLAPEELTSPMWRRFVQLSYAISEILGKLEREKVADRQGRLSGGPGWYGQKLKIHGLNAGLYLDADACFHLYPTPFWLSLPAASRPALARLALEPRRLFEAEGRPYVALPIRAGVERADVVEDVVAACRVVRELLIAAAPAPAPTDPAAPAGPAVSDTDDDASAGPPPAIEGGAAQRDESADAAKRDV